MEEDKKKNTLKKQRTRKLNCPFAVKLLQENFHSNTAVPFSWDRVPGHPWPDDTEANNTGNAYQTPPTPPPSRRWDPSAIEGAARADIQVVDQHGVSATEGIDIFSLAETTEGYAENCRTCSTEEPDEANQSADFIIQRFLPDAQALAAASIAQKKLLFSSPSSPDASISRSVGVSNIKGCGFRSLFNSLVKQKGRNPPGASKSDLSTSHSSNKHKKN